MPQIDPKLSTGIKGLDRVLKGLIPGDNLVFQCDDSEQYRRFAQPAADYAIRRNQHTVYFRFASHPPLFEDSQDGLETVELNPQEGFEPFIAGIHETIKRNGRGGYYIFDCLTDLATAWKSDQMLGNFFMLTCPRLYDVAAIAYFAVLRNSHSHHALSSILTTTQIFIDLISHEGRMYLHPLKVQQRYSGSMHTIHAQQGKDFVPITQSAVMSEIRGSSVWSGLDSSGEHLNVWNRVFLEAEETRHEIAQGQLPPTAAARECRKLILMAISRHSQIVDLAERYFTLSDLLKIRRRIIGTGLIGGKSVGMLMARAILARHDERWERLIEKHDSFYVGSDVFYSFLVTNGIWWIKQQKNLDMLLEGAITARQRMIVGSFPATIVKQLEDMLDYFGQSPVIVRSSSLLEDNYGNAFAGKYESVFCVNQGPRYKRLEDLMTAIRTIYASSMSEDALRYRDRRGMLELDEQMSLLVQRVSGEQQNHLFYPHAAGVGLSFNPYVWSEKIDPDAGALRMVVGMGTRAVDYKDNDYTRVVALNAPMRTPDDGTDDPGKYSQRNVDLLDLEANQLVSMDWRTAVESSPNFPIEMLCTRAERSAKPSQSRAPLPYRISFESLLEQTGFASDMRKILSALSEAYSHPVEIEFTLNMMADKEYRINIVQCRPFQFETEEGGAHLPHDLKEEDVLLWAEGAVIGRSRQTGIDRLIYVDPSAYDALPTSKKYSVARVIGKVVRQSGSAGKRVALIGPGRWGTSTPALGVPVNFSEISTVTALCEVVEMREGLRPDVSLGTHLFNEMVETGMLYVALFPERKHNRIDREAIRRQPNLLADIIDTDKNLEETLRVVDAEQLSDGRPLMLNADSRSSRAVLYLG